MWSAIAMLGAGEVRSLTLKAQTSTLEQLLLVRTLVRSENRFCWPAMKYFYIYGH